LKAIIRKTVVFVLAILATGISAFAQKTIQGIVSDSKGNRVEKVIVSPAGSADSVLTNHLGEYLLEVSDSCSSLVFRYESEKIREDIQDRKVVNVTLPIFLSEKQLLSMNPRLDYPLGVQFTIAGHSLFALSLNYFISDKQSFELGLCGRGLLLGTRRYFPLNDVGKNKALYTGLIANLPLDTDFVAYVPFGFHILSHNGMAFGIEVAGRTPVSLDQEMGVFNFLGFGINFGFQF